MRRLPLIGMRCCVITTGCRKEAQVNQRLKITEVSKVMAKADGGINLNHKQVLPVGLDREFRRGKRIEGAIGYCRQFSEREPIEAQFAAFKKIVKARSPIKLVEDAKDFKQFAK